MNRDAAPWNAAPLSLLFSVLTAILFGAVLTDVTYAAVLRDVLTPDQKIHVYGTVSDSMPMMLVAFGSVLVGVAGAILAGPNRRARWMLGLGVAILVGGNVIAPMVVENLRVDDSPGLGPLLRILLHAAVVVLAVLACLSWRRPQHHS
jgi:hypothetical protein